MCVVGWHTQFYFKQAGVNGGEGDGFGDILHSMMSSALHWTLSLRRMVLPSSRGGYQDLNPGGHLVPSELWSR